MNIVIINDNAQINGGATKIAILSARDLADQGHMVYFLTAVLPIGRELQGHPRIEVVCSGQFEILNDPNRGRAFAQGWWNPKARRTAKELFSRLEPENTVVHLHLWAKALSSSVVRQAVRSGFRVLCTLHDFLLACPTGTLFQHGRQAICHLKPMSPSCISCNCDTRNYGHKLWRVGRQVVQREFGLLPSGITAYIAHSALVAEVMTTYLPASSTVHQIPAYIESTPSAPASPADYHRFIYLGRLVREKGVLLAARACKAENLPITFAGSGELADEIAAIYPAATLTGWLDHESSLAQLRQSRALIFPSLWYETFGLVVLEAAANGIPSIVPDTSAARELVIDGVTGLHFKNGSEEDLRAKLRALRDPVTAARLGREAHTRFWQSNFASGTAHLRALEKIYQSTLEGTHARTQRIPNSAVQGVA